MKIFSGTSNPAFTNSITQQLKMQEAKSEVIRYTNSECKVTILEDVIDEDCLVVQSTCNPTDQNLVELLFFIDALRRSRAKNIFVLLPYFGYAKQNFQHRPGECVSVEVVIKMLESLGVDSIMTYDIHDEGTKGIPSVPFVHFSAFPALIAQLRSVLPKDVKNEDLIVVSPDQGGVERARDFSTQLQGDGFEIAVVEKHRDANHMNQITTVGFYGDVKNKIAIIIDDMIVSGGTMVPAVEQCRAHGARDIMIAVSHPDFSSDAPQKLKALGVKHILVANTIPLLPDVVATSGVQVVDASSPVADWVRENEK